MITTTTRNANIQDFVALLRDQQGRKLDVVTDQSKIRSEGGLIVVEGSEPQLGLDGVTMTDGRYRPTQVFDEGIASKLNIPLTYVRRLRAERPDLYDANVNGLLRGGGEGSEFAADPRKFMLRLFRGDEGETGVGRAFVSDKYALIENLDIMMTTLEAIKSLGVEVEFDGLDLSERRMYARIKAPQVQALAPTLLKNYRSPFTGDAGADNPVVFAGIEIRNSEVGNGAFSIVPRLIVQVCTNGMTVTKDAMRAVHLGGKLEEGVVNWTQDTQRKALDLISAKTRDAVSTFMDLGYLERTIEAIEETSVVKVKDVADTLTVVSKKLAFDEVTQAGILDHFIKGGDVTAGGVLHAVTSYAQTVKDADAAAELASVALRAMELAAAASA